VSLSTRTILVASAAASAASGALAQPFAMTWHAADCGGVTTPLAAGAYTLRTAIGQSGAGPAVAAGAYRITPGFLAAGAATGGSACYANCDASTQPPILNVGDFSCFLSKYAAGDPYANCDGSTIPPVMNVNDFLCFQSRFASGCSAP